MPQSKIKRFSIDLPPPRHSEQRLGGLGADDALRGSEEKITQIDQSNEREAEKRPLGP